MLRRRLVSLLFALALIAAMLAVGAERAGALTNTCGMTEFPAKIFSYSGLKVACSSDGTSAPASALTIHDFNNSVWHVGSSRTITAATTLNSATITSATGQLSAVAGVAGDIHRAISGPGIPNGTWIKSVSGTTAVLSAKATATASAASLTIENNTARSVTDATLTNASTTVTSATAAFNASDGGQFVYGNGIKPGTKIASVTNATTVVLSIAADRTATNVPFTISDSTITTARAVADAHTTTGSATVTSASAMFAAADTGTGISGAGVPAGTYIKTVTNATTIVMSKTATATATAAKIVVGQKTVSAPKDGDHVSQLGGELNLSPTFVPTVDQCSEGTPEGFVLNGDWYNPGSFVGTGTPPARTIAQIVYKTSTINFYAWVVAQASDTAIASAHFDVTIPAIPTSLVACPNSPSVTTLTFNAAASSQESVPGTPFVRAIPDVAGAGPVSATGKVTAGANTYTTTCSIGRQIGAPAFSCGNATVGLAG